MIQFDNVSKSYVNGQQGLNCVSFEIGSGEMAFLTGHSGSGKSTLLRLLALIDRPTEGTIYFANKNLNHVKKRHIPYLRRSMGIVFQNPHLLQDRTIFENVALPLEIAGFDRRFIASSVRTALDSVGLLDKEKLKPVDLSGGQQQRVGIARAVVHMPTVLLADKPTGNLDPELSTEILRLFERFNQEGVCVLIATHDLSLIAGMRHRILELDKGSLVSTGL